ncbi:WYL domain-containing protein [Flavobacterium sp. P21]|uniref:WYL domain-containing protein n=1 Tax=Flavobacterium sp. P21 TaxID=3423948 RepID=UPI003D667B0A
MSLESNIDYKGYDYITPLFNAIVNKIVVKINYAPFGKQPYNILFHPYFLKQYNNRWFVLGYNEFNENAHWNLALDRINGEIITTSNKYKTDTTDWEEYFEEIIGVSKPIGDEVTEVKLVFDKEQAPYIQTKPVHSTQRNKILDDGALEIRINVIINYELETRILSFGEKVKVVAPQTLVECISKRIKLLNDRY